MQQSYVRITKKQIKGAQIISTLTVEQCCDPGTHTVHTAIYIQTLTCTLAGNLEPPKEAGEPGQHNVSVQTTVLQPAQVRPVKGLDCYIQVSLDASLSECNWYEKIHESRGNQSVPLLTLPSPFKLRVQLECLMYEMLPAKTEVDVRLKISLIRDLLSPVSQDNL